VSEQEQAGPRQAPARETGAWSKVLLWAVALLGGIMLVFAGVQEARQGALVSDGTSVPSFRLQRYAGGTLELSALRGKVVMLDFWATWCPPCVYEMPYLVKVAREYESKGLVFVAASRDDGDTAPYVVDAFIKQRLPDLAPYAVYAPDEMAQVFQVQALPTLYLLDREGKVVDAQRGALDEDELRRRVERVLNAP
jgi:thiol-disulfide isomerase/thioredoxin